MSKIHTFFCYPYTEVASVEEAKRVIASIPAHSRIVYLHETHKPLDRDLRKLIEDDRGNDGRVVKLRQGGKWNCLWKLILEIEQLTNDVPAYSEPQAVWFISTLSAEAIAQAMRSHRTIPMVTNREQLWLDSESFGEECDEMLGMVLRSEMCYMTDRKYKDLSTQELFFLSAFEGLRFMAPCHDIHATAQILGKRVA